MRKRLILIALMVLTVSAIVSAQEDMLLFDWDAANLGLAYPDIWEQPVPAQAGDRLVLQMAQTLAGDPNVRPLSVQAITLTLIFDTPPDADPAQFVEEELAAQITPPTTDPITVDFIRSNAVTVSGTSPDGALYGVGRAVRFDDGRVLVMVGRAPIDERSAFLRLYDAVAESITPLDDVVRAEPQYGVAWSNIKSVSDGDEAFIDLIALAYDPNAGLFALDEELGLLQINPQDGSATSVLNLALLEGTTDLAVSASGNRYLAIPDCRCIRIFAPDGTLSGTLSNFAETAPQHIAIAADGTLYTTDETEAGYVVRIFQGSTERNIPLGDDVGTQPLLVVDGGGRLAAITSDGLVLALQGDAFLPLYELEETGLQMNAAAFTSAGELIVATADEGLLLFDTNGALRGEVGRLAEEITFAGDFFAPVGLAVGADDTIYVADSDGEFGGFTALNANIDPNRVGSPELSLKTMVQGVLTGETPQQAWTYAGTAGERLTISATDASGIDQIDLGLRLIAPDGSEIAFNNDQLGEDLYSLFDSQLTDVTLPIGGTYTIIVENLVGDGVYLLGMSRTELLTLNPDGLTQLTGILGDAYPTDRLEFTGVAGQTLTITMRAVGDDLDPLLRLVALDGTIVAENDDADDSALGRDAQLVQVQLPADGAYILEASRFEGVGDYELVIEAAGS
jgi:DNA-binding beta-propeller fold protein YncE